MTRAFVSGCAGPELTEAEIVFFSRSDPWGLILFARNIVSPDQVRALTASFREAVGRADAPVLIDQEGGRVQRMKPPHWPKYPAPGFYGDLFNEQPETGLKSAWLGARLIAADLHDVGITVACLPCLDTRFPETVDAIGDRAFSAEPETVALLGQAMVDGACAGGILPVIKHIPGHGRARVDSHLELPRVEADKSSLESVDFRPFKALSGVPLGMTAHIVYADVDDERPGTQSSRVIQEVIRRDIGFDGCLMSDDISMNALGGSYADRAQRAIDAGCDIVLHCNGDMEEMRAVAAAVPELAGRAKQRCDAALDSIKPPATGFDRDAAWEEFRSITGWQGV
ncbi:beta-N-acetylhexosaminidase [Roseibium aggregatum]|uniref:beta-N-acetylhexosaminidase n=1 Tax=Roseibium aggregatum TaxID=187304 RepID=A0A939J494_9HYPH|nr:beta-N-acetylhexosaminidase [Roseibium aggregatum]MBN9670469.1 beta-N-acetylhexosaminidase [Roseibium aggregatum]